MIDRIYFMVFNIIHITSNMTDGGHGWTMRLYVRLDRWLECWLEIYSDARRRTDDQS
jgi:hypothetical protein